MQRAINLRLRLRGEPHSLHFPNHLVDHVVIPCGPRVNLTVGPGLIGGTEAKPVPRRVESPF